MFISLISTFLSLFLPSGFLHSCKWVISYLWIRTTDLFSKKRFDYFDFYAKNEPEKVGFLSPEIEFELDSPRPDSHLFEAEDKVICYGVNSKSETLVVSVARLCDEKAEAIVYLRLANGKTYRLKDTSDYQQPISDRKVFSCGGLQMHYEWPIRKWRIFYSGFLSETSDEHPELERMVYVKFAFMWRASSNVFDFSTDVHPKLLADGLAKATWKQATPPISQLRDSLTAFALSGIITGTVSVEHSEDAYEMYLFGERIRSTSSTSFAETSTEHYLGYVHRNGSFVHFGKSSTANVAKDLHFGYVIQPDIDMIPITNICIDVIHTDSPEKLSQIKARFEAHHQYELSGSESSGKMKIDKANSNTSTSIGLFTFYLNGNKGSGICIKGHVRSNLKKKQHTPQSEPPKVQPLVVPFNEVLCQDPDITGGKGSSLGKLTSLSKELNNFIVPSGVVVTTAAYEKFITNDIAAAIKQLEQVLYGRAEGDVKQSCTKVCDKIIHEKISETLKGAILKSLNKCFPKKLRFHKFAVRSSATGEDTEQMSAAGQMDTFLGISGEDEILLAVKKCWASQFGYIAIEYKRRYGQVLNSPMAVVIQEMVSCDVAGVMFTCDPLTGNPSLMSITANYGLGESVVSGSEEPDAIELSRNYYDELTIRNKVIGAKSRKIIVKEGEGTILEEVPENQRHDCCLSDEMTLRVGRIGIQIEKHYRSRRDIEFGFWNNNLFIFQSRPVTSGVQETDFEIEHEFDGPLRVENDSFSVSNAAEVLPGSMSPLGYDVFFRMFNPVWQCGKKTEWQGDVPVRYFPVCWVTFNLHAMFNVADMFRGMGEKSNDGLEAATMVAFMGRMLDDPEIAQVSKDRFVHSIKKEWPWMKHKRIAEAVFFSGRHLERSRKLISEYRIRLEKCRTSEDVFEVLMHHSTDLAETAVAHLFCTQGSSMWNLLILTTLVQAKGALDDSVYKDFSTLVTTSSDVESADVPAAIQSLAYHVSQAIKPEDFKKMDTSRALQWLKSSLSAAGEKFRDFLTKHGHRCVKEFDIHSISWGSDPKPLVKLLQDLSGHVTADAGGKEASSFNALVEKLDVQLGFLTRLKLRFLLRMAQRGVQQREMSKSLWVKGIDSWRQGYRHLARVMVAEGRIPDEDIMFFMPIEEVRELLKTRTPKILAKARHRQRLHPKMDKYIFPEISRGVPRPIKYDDGSVRNTEESFTMKGIPVSQGVAKGYVRVALTLEDASHIKPGEILLAYSTDIGWSPYFPMLSGCVTELGGLISHGAVVSREYGLPCVAGLHGATRQFQTGDYVLLDGNKGELTKLSPPMKGI